MKNITLTLLGTSLLLTSFSASAFGRPSFETLDVNKDNKISKQEFKDDTPMFVPVEKIFKQLDANKDDHLDREEFDKAKRPKS